MHKINILLLSALLLLVGCTKKNEIILDDNENVKEPDPVEEVVEMDPIDELIKAMTLEEKIGQLLIVGKEGFELDDEDKNQIDTNKVGGFVFFSRNIESEKQVVEMLQDLNEYNSKNKIPLFLSLDEEGGKVTRLSKIYKRLPEAKVIGDKNNKEISFEFGEILGSMLKDLGFNLDFAPVLDINSNPKNPVIGSRAFGSTVDKVVNNGVEVMEGIKSVGVIPSVKHFPGHGDTSVDSHIDLPKVDKTYSELDNLELIPFKEAIKKDVDMIMVAHILFPQIDLDLPATLSEKIIKDILRDKLDFKGVIISDDITMGAIKKNYSIEEASASFIKNGGDIVLVCHGKDNPSAVIQKIKEIIDTGEMEIGELDKKLYRILSLKQRYKIEDNFILEEGTESINNRIINFKKRI